MPSSSIGTLIASAAFLVLLRQGPARRQKAFLVTSDRTSLRNTVALPLVLCLMGWAILLWAIANMSAPWVALTMPMDTGWSSAEILAVWLMWAVMMMAMMLPSAIPMMAAHKRLAAQQDPGRPDASLWFLFSYLLAWLLFSAAATALQWGFQRAGVLSHMLRLQSALPSGVILILAGAYQLSPLKAACLHHCRTAKNFLLSHWRSGRWGAARMGLLHGWHCVLCCTGLMMLLFVGGVMSLSTIVILTGLVATEKLAPRGQEIAKLIGIALVAWGLWQILGAMQSGA
jgi:predicted metal-binding membrane protein